jgi:hypothetical protein
VIGVREFALGELRTTMGHFSYYSRCLDRYLKRVSAEYVFEVLSLDQCSVKQLLIYIKGVSEGNGFKERMNEILPRF